MKSKIAQKILEETPQETKDKVREYTDKIINMKTKGQYIEEYINYLYGDIPSEDRALYQPEITQSRADFQSGFNLAEELFKPKWKSLEEYTPEEDTQVLCHLSNKWAKEVTKYSILRYFQNSWYGDITEDEKVEKFMEIPR